MNRAYILGIAAVLAVNPMIGCATLSADAAIVQQKISENATAISNFCTTKVLPVATSPETAIALLFLGSLPYGADLAVANAAVIKTCNDVTAVAQSATTLQYLQQELAFIAAGGKAPPPPVVAPAPVTATTALPGV